MPPPVRHIYLPKSNDVEQLAQRSVPTSGTPSPLQEADTTRAKPRPLAAARILADSSLDLY